MLSTLAKKTKLSKIQGSSETVFSESVCVCQSTCVAVASGSVGEKLGVMSKYHQDWIIQTEG